MKSYAMETAQQAAPPADAAQNGAHEAISTPTARTFAILDLVAHSPAAVDVASVIETLALPKATCPYRKSNPDVLMVQSSEVWDSHDAANGLNSTRRWCILVQR